MSFDAAVFVVRQKLRAALWFRREADNLYNTSTPNYFTSSLDGELVSATGTVSTSTSFQTDTNRTLTTGLEGYYKLEDASDNWSTNNLTNVGSVTFDGGKVNNAADLGASNTTKILDTTSSLAIDGGNISFACWVNIQTNPGNYFLVTHPYHLSLRAPITGTVLPMSWAMDTWISFPRQARGSTLEVVG